MKVAHWLFAKLGSLLWGLSILLPFCVGSDDAKQPVFVTPAAATAAGPDFELQGEYARPGLGLQVVAQGNGQFLAVTCKGGLPGAGWDGSERPTLDEDAAGVRQLIQSLELQRVERSSPTIGLAPPTGAVVLFDGSASSVEQHWRPDARRTDDGLLMPGATSVDCFQDHSLHLEFLTPFMPLARGQGRGNSGVYYQGRFETQILDSFGLSGQMNETGGIYSIQDPALNLCLPPLVWQTYDADFTAARYNDVGQKTANARLTVRLNGVVVQRDVELPHITTAAPMPESPEPGPLFLQDHGNPVRFRNIWVLPRDLAQEARRPLVPGFERFHAAAGGDDVGGGRLLLGELACTKCHSADRRLTDALLVKEPPVLDDVGARLHPEWMVKFLLSPHDVKPGSTMPGLLETLPDEEREPAARALTCFLTTTGRLSHSAPEPAAAQRGGKLFHQVGCVQCHAPRDGRSVATGTSVPLEGLREKYTVPSLAAFLKQPQKVRPTGRMPGWDLSDKELQDLAAFLIGEVDLRPLHPNLKASVYHGSWETLPEFSTLQPVSTSEVAGLDLSVAGRTDHFGLVFEGFLSIDKRGSYNFFLGSDDGSRLVIDDLEVVRNDGIHPHSVASGTTKLDEGPHTVRIEYFEQAGQESLSLEYESSQLIRQDVTHRLTLARNAVPLMDQAAADSDAFQFDVALVERGKSLFTSLGCASCHRLEQNDQRLTSTLKARRLADCREGIGCLSEQASQGVPAYDLSPRQREALSATLTAPAKAASAEPAEVVHRTMLAFNCYACHVRGQMGGPTPDRNPFFASTTPEMGDEGRLPPSLNGVGDKLNDGFLSDVLKNGASDRPYMRTQMPKFGDRDRGHLQAAFVKLDRRDEVPLVDVREPLHRIKAAGRQLAGDKGLACIKCHSFGSHRATGIQAINLLSMSRRLREDWFQRYLINPNEYRPGTRMPTGFPDGQATIRDVYNGDPLQQVTAIWKYLQDGSKAGIPDGLIAQMVELNPTSDPIIYRNFIDGLSPRGIAVGYPEKCHLAWDANRMSLGLIWHGRFIDATRHWEGRGQGFQSPLGDHVLKVDETVPLARLASADAPWPTEDPHLNGYHFRGYRLNDHKQPEFRYDGPGFSAVEFDEPISRGVAGGDFRRRFTITPTADAGPPLYFRAARGKTIEPVANGGWLINGALTVRLPMTVQPTLRDSQGAKELILPVPANGQPFEIVQELDW
ncbi:MAG: family 16 glycoside hydrolase [Planctomycetaceae bacterium]